MEMEESAVMTHAHINMPNALLQSRWMNLLNSEQTRQKANIKCTWMQETYTKPRNLDHHKSGTDKQETG